MSSGLEQSPAVTFRPAELPSGSFAGVDALPAALTALDSSQRPPPSELTILAQRLGAVSITSPDALQSVVTKLDFGDENAPENGRTRPEAAIVCLEPLLASPVSGVSPAVAAAGGNKFTPGGRPIDRSPLAPLPLSQFSHRLPLMPTEHRSSVQILSKGEEGAVNETAREKLDGPVSAAQNSHQAGAPIFSSSSHLYTSAIVPSTTVPPSLHLARNLVTPSRPCDDSACRQHDDQLREQQHDHGVVSHQQPDSDASDISAHITSSDSIKLSPKTRDFPARHQRQIEHAPFLASLDPSKEPVGQETGENVFGSYYLGKVHQISREVKENSPKLTTDSPRSGLIRAHGVTPDDKTTVNQIASVDQGSHENREQSILSSLQENVNLLSSEISQVGWRDWVEALDSVTRCLGMDTPSELVEEDPPRNVVCFIKDRRNMFLNAVGQSLGEIRPTILASTFMLVDALITRDILAPFDLSEQVVEKVFETASGTSVNSLAAAKCLVSIFAAMSDLPPNFKCESYVSRLRAACSKVEQSVLITQTVRERWRIATAMLDRLSIAPSPARDAHTKTRVEQGVNEPANSDILVPSDKIFGLGDLQDAAHCSVGEPVENMQPQQNSPYQGSSGKPPRPILSNSTLRTSSKSAFSAQPVTPVSARATDDQEQISSNRYPLPCVDRSTPHSPAMIPLTDQAKLDDISGDRRLSTKKITPISQRKKRLYTQEELDEARRVALRQAMDTAKEIHAEERFRMESHVKKLESQNEDMQLILAQYEETMTVMVEKEKSAATSSKLVEAEAEICRLKAELLEMTDAFDKLKERYDQAKAQAAESEVRETRLIEQNRELKKTMVDLQKWSNDLKANTEKKLSSSFEAASKFRTMYLDKEAREAKAVENLQVAQEELVQREDALAKAMVKVGQLETNLAAAEDVAKSRENAILHAKAELGEATTKLSQQKFEIADLHRQLAKAEDASKRLEVVESAAVQAENKLKATVTENQSLKVRAYDDLTRIKELEIAIGAKNKEIDELNCICEELLGKLESGK